MRIDVCVPVLHKPPTQFEEMLKRELPVNEIIYSFAKPLGTARQELIEKVTTDWFVFVDDDVELLPGWWDEVWRLVDPLTGAVEGLWSYTVEPEVDAYQNAMADLARALGKKTSVERLVRAFTGDALIRTELVKDIKIPPVPVYEDEFIKQHIITKGPNQRRTPDARSFVLPDNERYRWKRTSGVVCLHHRGLNIGQAWIAGYYAYYFGRMTPKQAVKNLVTIGPKTLYAVWRTGMWKIIPMQLNRELRTSLGCLTAWAKGDRFQ